jgi:hypothetical protein
VNDTFEREVEGMLADQATVSRSTVDLTRASIAALPDRRPTRLTRLRPSATGRGFRWPRALAFTGTAVVVAAIVAVSLYGRWQSGPIASGSPMPSAAVPTMAPTSSPGPRATPAFPETLPVVYTGGALYVAGWAPDGSSFAIVEFTKSTSGFSPPTDPTVHIFDRAGAEIESVQAERFAWLSASNFVILRADAPTGSSGRIEAYMGWVGTPQLTALGNYDNLVAGPSGEVALMLPWDGTIATQPQYVVVSGGSVSEPRDGYPAAWSRDGSMLAVFHVTGPTGPRAVGSRSFGWLEVVRSTGESVASVRQLESDVTAQVAFSPDGTRVAFSDDGSAASKGEQIGVLEVASGLLTAVQKFGPFTWVSNEDLLFVDSSSGIPSENTRVYSWSATTGQLDAYGTGNSVGSSGAGVVVVGSDITHRLTWTSSAPGSASGEFSLGAGPWMGVPDSAWSPDGKTLILIAGDGTDPLMDAVITQF